MKRMREDLDGLGSVAVGRPGSTAAGTPAGARPFAARVSAWQRAHGRNDLPWQQTRDAYRVWLSEVMLQQTQVATVIPYFLRFIERFPDVRALARASLDDVMPLWSGLGYYSRARNLHAAARTVEDTHGGAFPRDFDAIAALPGVGRSTAGAICALAFGQRRPILDGNVRRVLCRHAGIEGDTARPAVQRVLWQAAEARLPDRAIEAYTQGMMDLGATLCTRARPRCGDCPVAEDCHARANGCAEQLPSPRARRAPQRRSTRMLLLVAGERILLEKRPAPGVWGGLWSFPEAACETDPAEAAARMGLTAESVTELAPLEHAFTHFVLDIRPCRIVVAPGATTAEEPGRRWLLLADAPGAGVPAPVDRLLRGLAGNGAGSTHPRRRKLA